MSRFWRDERGATAIEVGLIVCLISVALITALTAMGTKISSTMTKVSTAIGS